MAQKPARKGSGSTGVVKSRPSLPPRKLPVPMKPERNPTTTQRRKGTMIPPAKPLCSAALAKNHSVRGLTVRKSVVQSRPPMQKMCTLDLRLCSGEGDRVVDIVVVPDAEEIMGCCRNKVGKKPKATDVILKEKDRIAPGNKNVPTKQEAAKVLSSMIYFPLTPKLAGTHVNFGKATDLEGEAEEAHVHLFTPPQSPLAKAGYFSPQGK